jgi:hypothetical protein
MRWKERGWLKPKMNLNNSVRTNFKGVAHAFAPKRFSAQARIERIERIKSDQAIDWGKPKAGRRSIQGYPKRFFV